jgi:hypothetical protein
MNENCKKVYFELIDLIEVLKQKDKCECPEFQIRWLKKCQSVRERVNQLCQDDFNSVEKEYLKWCNKQKNETTNTVRPTS